ncbi:MAG: helix-turn-helix domain-containing protein [Candidatus Accumulibacter sp.]|nr:helix-turn-helix domain-containing protein [Accumulibacter sp.]
MKPEQTRAWYAAFKAKDARFDGRFFVGVSSTGIYCRPICPAKLPREENCTFFESAASAEHAGYRPCLMCRPELAPGAAPIDATSVLAHKAARLLEENCGSGQSMEEYARRLGCSGRHFRRAFTVAFKVSPVQYLQTCRLLLAKNLLTDTRLSVTDVAMTAGFGSLRRFNDLFKTRYRIPPSALRKQTPNTRDDALMLTLAYRPPYQWREMIDFLAQRAIPGVENVVDDRYTRTADYVNGAHKHIYGCVRVEHRPQKNALTVTIASSLLPALPRLLARVRNLFDLYCTPDAVYETLSVMNDTRPGVCVSGVRLPGCFDPFETSVRAILGQQITVRAASTLAGRLAKTFGAPVDTGVEGLTHCFPSAHDIAALSGNIADRLGPLGIRRARANTILALAQKIVGGEIDFSLCVSPESEIKKLQSIPGLGVWTAQTIAMRAMSWPDAFPHTDHGVKKALAPRSGKEILEIAELWRPWRAYATINLWNSLQEGTTCSIRPRIRPH